MTDEQKQKIADDYANKFDDTTWDEKSVWAAHYDGVMFGLNARDEEVRIAQNDRDIIEAKLIAREDENKVLREALEKIARFARNSWGAADLGLRDPQSIAVEALEALTYTSKKEV